MTKNSSDLVKQLFKHGAIAGLDYSFMRKVIDAYANQRSVQAQQFVAGLTSGHNEAEDRLERLAAFLGSAPGILDLLHGMMFGTLPANAEHDRARAAVMLLFGGERGYWRVSPRQARLARALIRRHPEFEEFRQPWEFQELSQ